MPGINFLSGGMSEEDATVALNEINKFPGKKRTSRACVWLCRPLTPIGFLLAAWTFSFSYGRALQQTVLQTWQGKAENVEAAQAALMVRAKANGEATKGVYGGGAAGGAGAGASLHVSNYTY